MLSQNEAQHYTPSTDELRLRASRQRHQPATAIVHITNTEGGVLAHFRVNARLYTAEEIATYFENYARVGFDAVVPA